MDTGANINRIIKKLCKEIFPNDVFQKGNSRVYLDDNGYYLTMIEFQPYSLGKGTFLNIGLDFLFDKDDHLFFSYSYNRYGDPRVGNTFIEYKNDEQFEREVKKYVELANEYILKYRSFSDINYAKQCYISKLDDDNWNPYIKSMFYFLTDDVQNGRKYYQMFLDEPFFERIIDTYNYPRDISIINKNYVMDIISERRKFWHSKSSMRKMKYIKEYEI